MNLYRQERLLLHLLRHRWRHADFDHIGVEVYDTFEESVRACRVEVFRGGRSLRHRLAKFESVYDAGFVRRLESAWGHLIERPDTPDSTAAFNQLNDDEWN